jgi:cytochrome P450
VTTIVPALTDFDPQSAAFFEDRHAWYRRLRDEAPVYLFEVAKQPERSLCLLTRYQDVVDAFLDRRLVREYSMPRAAGEAARSEAPVTFRSVTSHWMVYRDPPQHIRLRGPVNRSFAQLTPRFEPLVRQIVSELLDGFTGRAEIDLIRDVAFAVPARTICAVVGVQLDDLDDFRRWMRGFNGALERRDDVAAWRQADAVCTELAAQLRDIVRPGPGRQPTVFMEQVRQLGGDPTRVADEEMIANLMLVLFAGHETTLNLIGNTVLLLLQHPEQRQRLEANPALIESAIEEVLRFEAPVQMTYRGPTEDIDLHGICVPARTKVALVLGSASRDPTFCPDPDAFDIGRGPTAHLAFGHGPHYCPGAALGRLEARIAVGELFRRFPDLQATDSAIRWRRSLTYRALEQFLVHLKRSTPSRK